jgi:hypothetical protein
MDGLKSERFQFSGLRSFDRINSLNLVLINRKRISNNDIPAAMIIIKATNRHDSLINL